MAQPTFEGVQCNAAGQVVLKLNTPCHDAATYPVMSPLEFGPQRIELPVCGGQIHWSYVTSGSGTAGRPTPLTGRSRRGR
jgi:hypothetical protein